MVEIQASTIIFVFTLIWTDLNRLWEVACCSRDAPMDQHTTETGSLLKTRQNDSFWVQQQIEPLDWFLQFQLAKKSINLSNCISTSAGEYGLKIQLFF